MTSYIKNETWYQKNGYFKQLDMVHNFSKRPRKLENEFESHVGGINDTFPNDSYEGQLCKLLEFKMHALTKMTRFFVFPLFYY